LIGRNGWARASLIATITGCDDTNSRKLPQIVRMLYVILNAKSVLMADAPELAEEKRSMKLCLGVSE
jgi:hypothetical protein